MIKYRKTALPLLFAMTLGLSPVLVYAQEIHTVKSGDTLWGISRDLNVTVNDIKKWNNLDDNLLRVGQKLMINPDTKKEETTVTVQIYTVKSGDSLYQIGQTYKVSVDNLMKWNDLKTATIFIGQKLKVNQTTTKPTTPNTPTTPTKPTTPNTPTEQTYIVKSGDTLYAISREYHVTVANIRTWNNLKSDALSIGQKLTLKSTVPGQKEPDKTETVTVKIGEVTANVLNMRSGAGTTNSVVGTLNKGDKVVVLEEKNDWANIDFNGKKGWVSSDFLTIKVTEKETTTPPVQEVKKQYKVNATSLNLRTGPSTSESILTAIPNGTVLSILESKNDWSKVTYNGKTGWVSTEFLKVVVTSTPNGKTVVLDAGHGGTDPGAIAPDKTTENSVNLATTLKLQQELVSRGYKVVMIRTGDTSCENKPVGSAELQCRVNFSANNNANVYVSIHANTAPGAKGTETYYSSLNKYASESIRLANEIHNKYQPVFGSDNRKVKDYPNLYVAKNNTVPSVLLEVGFLSHPSDLEKLKSSSMQQNVAKAVADGIDNYFGF